MTERKKTPPTGQTGEPQQDDVNSSTGKSAAQDGRARDWTDVCYPESMPENWRDIIDAWHIPVLVSPLHDEDKEATGEPKKPHYHLLLKFNGKKSYSQVKQLTDQLNAAPPQSVNSYVGMARYLTHKDSPDKAQYDPERVLEFGGADYHAAVMQPSDFDKELSQIEQWVDSTGCYSYAALCEYARDYKPEWTRTIRSHTVHLSAYLRSRQWEMEHSLSYEFTASDLTMPANGV